MKNPRQAYVGRQPAFVDPCTDSHQIRSRLVRIRVSHSMHRCASTLFRFCFSPVFAGRPVSVPARPSWPFRMSALTPPDGTRLVRYRLGIICIGSIDSPLQVQDLCRPACSPSCLIDCGLKDPLLTPIRKKESKPSIPEVTRNSRPSSLLKTYRCNPTP